MAARFRDPESAPVPAELAGGSLGGRNPRTWIAVSLALTTVGFLLLTRHSVTAYFAGDDLMNMAAMHVVWHQDPSAMVRDVLTVATPVYRPVGGLWYWAMWRMAGFSPLAYRLTCLAWLLLNTTLAFWLIRRLAGTVVAAVAVPVFIYHPAMQDLYYNSGTIYDSLCFSFCVGALLAVEPLFSKSNARRSVWVFVVLTLYGLALGSKEMAAGFPLVLLAFAVLRAGGLRSLWAYREMVVLLFLMAGLTALYLFVKLMPENSIGSNPLYRPHLSFEAWAVAVIHYSRLLFGIDQLGGWSVVGLGAAMVIAGCVLRSAAYWFGFFFFVVSALPVCFIPPRAAFVMYLPWLGFSLSLAVAIDAATRRLVSRTALVLAMPVLCAVLQARGQTRYEEGYIVRSESLRSIANQIKAALPVAQPRSRLAVINTPYGENDYSLRFLIQLMYNDPTLLVELMRADPHAGDPNELSLYDVILHWDRGKLVALRQPGLEGKAVPLKMEPSIIRAGEAYQVNSELHDSVIEVVYELSDLDDPNARPYKVEIGRRWCRLDALGRVTLHAPVSHPEARVTLRAVREVGGKWQPTYATIKVVRNAVAK